ncbi:hypothetical protein GIB67_005381 [Kingdonia uniflora]|uniref:Uncharacterized protein n=1 Tax=Kingdonia uniflora TaxID=39325 RepID=A0A7J7NH04_9MAGN|nr:hypothetical protein GIB67_005381 [Kingdonia uniflora]
MEGFLSKKSEIEEEEEEYAFASEYDGPPLNYELPRAVPIDIKRIPTASIVASETSLSDRLLLPVVQPILAKTRSVDIVDSIVSPNSVITFEEIDGDEIIDEISSFSTLGFSNSHDPSGELFDTSGVLEFSTGQECSLELSGRIDSLDTLGFSTGSSGVLGFEKDDGNLECGNGSPKRTAVVKFRDADSSGRMCDELSQVESETILERRESDTRVKKGSCYRCFKGNRFTEKEVCIVCNAKYCSNCVLRAMGSMPEGRKCVPCIGYPIDESKRAGLGKCSRMLKKLLSQLEIRQIMNVEKFCDANQLQAENVYVNGVQLCQEELLLLQCCPIPPPKLKPGRYWYDKVSGLWGKEGNKPCSFISPHMNVGGAIMPHASNGNTRVFINNREITKVELRMLQLAGVQCAGNPHFWVDEDGSYQEEGQKNVKGNLWSKAGTKLVCTVLSLPFPSKATNLCREETNDHINRGVTGYPEKRMTEKLLLVGYSGSGTSTILKQASPLSCLFQAKILYKAEPFSEEERESIKLMIQTNVYRYLGVLLEGRERFEEESLSQMRENQSHDHSVTVGSSDEINDTTIYSIGPRLKAFSDWLLKVMMSGNLEAIFPAATREYAPLVEELWRDAAIQATFNRKSELQVLPSIASYFLEQVVDISRPDYEPSNADILYAEGITSSNGLACTDFSFPQSRRDGYIDAADPHEPLLRYQLIRVHARGLGENFKWLEMFEDVRIAVFCVDLSDYDQFCDEGNGVPVNKMVASRTLFESVISHPIFDNMEFLLILNKFDQLEQKIERVPLSQCEWFDDFNPLISCHRSNKSSNSGSSLAHQAFYYIAVKFKRYFYSLTGRKLYVSLVNGLDPDTVDGALRYAREIMKWDEERANFSTSEYSVYSTEQCSDFIE